MKAQQWEEKIVNAVETIVNPATFMRSWELFDANMTDPDHAIEPDGTVWIRKDSTFAERWVVENPDGTWAKVAFLVLEAHRRR